MGDPQESAGGPSEPIRGDGGEAVASSEPDRDRSLLVGGGLFGVGLGALVDVAVFHHVLQWHHLLSAVRPPSSRAALRWNVYYDGLFSLVVLAVLVVGAALVWRASNRASAPYSTRYLLGSVLVGAGAFNVFDAVVDHYLLHLHDVVHGTRALNPHWLGASLLLLGVGLLVLGRGDGR